MKTRNRRYPDRLGWSGTNLENRERFYFPVASQISAMIGDHSRQMKTHICTVGDVGDGCSLIQKSPKLLGSSPPITNKHGVSRESGTDFWRLSDISANLGWSTNSKIPVRLGFSRHMKTRLTCPSARVNLAPRLPSSLFVNRGT